MHDHIQEAAYSLIPEGIEAASHLRIGKFLAAHQRRWRSEEEAIFESVNQLNRAPALLTSPDERERFAELNLIAGKRAKASTAYASALNYLTAAVALLPVDSWECRHTLMFELTLEPGRVRVPDRCADGSARASERAFTPCDKLSRKGNRRRPAYRCMDDTRSGHTCHGRCSRIPTVRGH